MRGNNKRKLIPQHQLFAIKEKFHSGVPISKLIREYELDISHPHLRKLLFIYIDILNPELNLSHRKALNDSIFPIWLENKLGAVTQPDSWTYEGRFPYGTWEKK